MSGVDITTTLIHCGWHLSIFCCTSTIVSYLCVTGLSFLWGFDICEFCTFGIAYYCLAVWNYFISCRGLIVVQFMVVISVVKLSVRIGRPCSSCRYFESFCHLNCDSKSFSVKTDSL